jgi:hypothetical protein
VARVGGAARLSSEWRAWLAENLLWRVPNEELIASLAARGVPAQLAWREIEQMARSPILRGAARVARLVRKHEVVVRMQRAMNALASSPRAVERRSHVSTEEFFDRYYAGNVPLVITDALEPWPAARRWSPAEWKARFGCVLVEVTTGREADPIFEPNFRAHCTSIGMGELCDRIVAAGTTNDLYLIGNNHLAKRSGLEAVFDDIRGPHPYLDEKRDGEAMTLWFGRLRGHDHPQQRSPHDGDRAGSVSTLRALCVEPV